MFANILENFRARTKNKLIILILFCKKLHLILHAFSLCNNYELNYKFNES